MVEVSPIFVLCRGSSWVARRSWGHLVSVCLRFWCEGFLMQNYLQSSQNIITEQLECSWFCLAGLQESLGRISVRI